MAGWFGQVGSDIQIVASGAARRISSNSWRIAPVPPGAWPPVSRSLGRSAPKISSAMASTKARSPRRPT